MKKNIITMCLFLSTFTALFAQTKSNKNNFSLGGGRQSYNGDLGNSWFDAEEEWYGFVRLGYSRYLNRSFDASFTTSVGDFGHCREDDESPYRADGSEVLNMRSRMTAMVFTAKYKFANGYLLKEEARIAPFVFGGIGINNLHDNWTTQHNRVRGGDYTSLNIGAGFDYRFLKVFNVGFNVSIGYFNKDNLDYRAEGKNDMYKQSAIMLGMNF